MSGIFSLLFLFLTMPLLSTSAQAAPCCSGAVVMPTLITTDSKAQLAGRLMGTQAVGRSRMDGTSVFHRDGNTDNTVLWELAGAYALSPRWQIHGAVPVSLRARGIDSLKENHTGLGDVSAGGAFEALEELLFNPYKPRVWVFMDVTMPTGRSAYDDITPLAASVHGRGSWAATMGAFAGKTWGGWDAALSAQHGRSLPSRHDVNGRSVLVRPGAVTALTAAGGHSFGELRLGLSVGPTWEQRTMSDYSSSRDTTDRLWWTVGAQASLMADDHWSFTASYNDQTLLGPTYNAVLGRSMGLAAIRRFD